MPITPELLEELREAVADWDAAVDGDSGDAEFEAGFALADAARALLEP